MYFQDGKAIFTDNSNFFFFFLPISFSYFSFFLPSTTKAVDVWAYAVLLIRLFTLSWPYPRATTVHDLTIHVARNELRPKNVNSRDLPHPDLKDVIERCLSFDETQRFTFSQIEAKLAQILKQMQEIQDQKVEECTTIQVDTDNEHKNGTVHIGERKNIDQSDRISGKTKRATKGQTKEKRQSETKETKEEEEKIKLIMKQVSTSYYPSRALRSAVTMKPRSSKFKRPSNRRSSHKPQQLQYKPPSVLSIPYGALSVSPGKKSITKALHEISKNKFLACKMEDLNIGLRIRAKFKSGDVCYFGIIETINDNETCTVKFDDGDIQKNTPLEDITVTNQNWKQKWTSLYLQEGIHDEGGKYVELNISIAIIGAHRLNSIMRGGWLIHGETTDVVKFKNMTISSSIYSGINGEYGASFLCDDVLIENSAGNGVIASNTKGTLKNVEVCYSGWSGVVVDCDTGLVELDGTTTVHDNCIKDRDEDYGLNTKTSTSAIQIINNHSKIAINNGGGGNYGGVGQIE